MSSEHGVDDFDLPRWQTHSARNYLPNSPAAAQYSSLYGALPPQSQPPPPPPPVHSADHSSHRPPPLNTQGVQSTFSTPAFPSAPVRQQRNDSDQLRLQQQSQQNVSLSRSLSLGGVNLPRPRNNMDDLEGAYGSVDAQEQRQLHQQPLNKPSEQTSANSSFYPPSISYTTTAGQQQYGAPPPEPYREAGPTYDSHHSPRVQTAAQLPQLSAAVSTPRRGGNAETFTQHSPLYQASSGYGNNFSSGTQYQPQTPSKPSTPYMSTLPQSSQYSQTYNNALEPSRVGHVRSSSQTQLPNPHTQFQNNSFPATSTPSSPLSYQAQQTTTYFTSGVKDEPMDDLMPPPVSSRPESRDARRHRRPSGFRRLRDSKDLRPIVNVQPMGRRGDPSKPGGFLSPLLCLTTQLASTYNICNPQFRYESSHNPRRVLTKPSKPVHNDGFDNEDYDYILYVNDWLGTEDGNKYLILDVLGQGTFGQVVKCQNMKTHDVVAVKVVKNKPAYFNQSMMEVTILDMLNNQHDPNDERHILRMLDSFVHKNHLCLVFELLSQNLYELIKQNQFQGLSTQLVKVFTAQLLDALCILKDARLIHCDLKPENILLKSLSSPAIKVIDFGSACHERQTVYTYIQSRFYRSPEVLLGLSYNSAIDMWSLGCIAVELFLGLPLFPGTSEYNQITRIVEMLGLPPVHMLEHGKQTSQFFDSYTDSYGKKEYKLKSLEQYSREHNTQEQPGKQYFKANTLPEIINIAPMPPSRHSSSRPASAEMEREANNRAAFIDFCLGLLNLNPMERWTPQQARRHPFITGEKFVKRWQPYGPITDIPAPTPALTLGSADPRRPYGGLVQTQSRGTRAYQDAAAYNQQLNQHQTYTAQQQAAQVSNQAYRNPYVAPQGNNQTQGTSHAFSNRHDDDYSSQQQQDNQASRVQHPAYQQGHQVSSANSSLSGTHSYNQPVTQSSQTVTVTGNPNPPSNSYYPNARTRASTINQMDHVPPALARLTQMNKDISGIGRNTLTPIINRDDAMREWERRQAGKAQPAQLYPQLEYLQQQAELAAGGWQQGSTSNRYIPPPATVVQYQTPVQLLVDNSERRRERGRQDQRQDYPQTSFSGSDTALGSMYIPMQPNHYGAPTNSQQPASLYSGTVAAVGQPSLAGGSYPPKMNYSVQQGQYNMSQDTRRNSGMGMDTWRG